MVSSFTRVSLSHHTTRFQNALQKKKRSSSSDGSRIFAFESFEQPWKIFYFFLVWARSLNSRRVRAALAFFAELANRLALERSRSRRFRESRTKDRPESRTKCFSERKAQREKREGGLLLRARASRPASVAAAPRLRPTASRSRTGPHSPLSRTRPRSRHVDARRFPRARPPGARRAARGLFHGPRRHCRQAREGRGARQGRQRPT